ncbi:MAG: radical SAM family heme chaperone HemW [Dethiobacter sp.]|jgi:oxygen-independent coproporphyrinogen-3 oxidase|nr:radical SAM family heme chaperone HemW [Dethiobacter sp.]
MGVAVYIHIPYCFDKCHYCDFVSFPAFRAPLCAADYLDLLASELALRGKELYAGGHAVTTVYLGGGTPTVLGLPELAKLLADCRRCLPLQNAEWTVEANPGTVDAKKLSLLSSHGVNRVSLGVQDLDDGMLALLGRKHNAAEAKEAFILCRRYFSSVSVDLMYELPGQRTDGFLSTLTAVIAWRPEHLSLFGLKIEEGTRLAALIKSGCLALPDEEDGLGMLIKGKAMLEKNGYKHYEIASYALPGHFCRHNLTYWNNKPYLGLGLGAHSYWQNIRQENTTDILEYRRLLAQGLPPTVKSITPSRRQEMEDTMILGLRKLRGVSFESFYERFGQDLRDVFRTEIDRLLGQGLIICDGETLRLAESKIAVANHIFAEFIKL